MVYRSGRTTDFTHLQTFVWQAIYPVFDVDGLTEEQRAENDRTVETAPERVADALTDPRAEVIVAHDERRRTLGGYVVVRRRPDRRATIDQLFVRSADRGRGIGTELLNRVTQEVGPHFDLVVALRPYYPRAIEFFEKHGFVDTGETHPDLDLRVFLRPGSAVVEGVGLPEEEDDSGSFPEPDDEPYLQPVFESLPDYNLASDELSDEPMFDPENSTLDEKQISELEAFIARAKEKKRQQSPGPTNAVVDTATLTAGRHPEIEFEIDYGVEEDPEPKQTSGPLPFDFAFDEVEPDPNTIGAPRHQAKEVDEDVADSEDTLDLEDIPAPEPEVTVADLRTEFEDRLGDRLSVYFGADALPKYLETYWKSDNFQQIRDAGLAGLARYLNQRPAGAAADRRRDTVLSDLIEYFIVETASELHGNRFPQRLLRYQGVDWKKVDLFRLVMDYLDFTDDEVVYTDFVTMPAKVLKNASAAYLQATRDERVFVICDQSLFGNGKQGFAITDAALYWKNVLQPAGTVAYHTLERTEPSGDHLMLDGQYFDAGSRLNLRVALLLDKLRRMDLGD